MKSLKNCAIQWSVDILYSQREKKFALLVDGLIPYQVRLFFELQERVFSLLEGGAFPVRIAACDVEAEVGQRRGEVVRHCFSPFTDESSSSDSDYDESDRERKRERKKTPKGVLYLTRNVYYNEANIL